MANLEQYRVNPKSNFSLKSIKSTDKSERSGTKEQNAQALETLGIEISVLDVW